ncbi:hypothetical protein CPC08DRAFT_212635 [Agrocybe pediades]|nr:hypothetical protein CPC08DRAFT_212635 [Agrocybe pediades]
MLILVPLGVYTGIQTAKPKSIQFRLVKTVKIKSKDVSERVFWIVHVTSRLQLDRRLSRYRIHPLYVPPHHEVGHWLRLFHSFEAGRSDSVRDNITDTPLQASGSDGCPKGRGSCPRDGQHLIEAPFGLPGAQRPHGMILVSIPTAKML